MVLLLDKFRYSCLCSGTVCSLELGEFLPPQDYVNRVPALKPEVSATSSQSHRDSWAEQNSPIRCNCPTCALSFPFTTSCDLKDLRQVVDVCP